MTLLLIGMGCTFGAAGVGFLLGRMGSQLNRRPARGPAHQVWRDIYPQPPGAISVDCRCVIGRDHWQDGQPR